MSVPVAAAVRVFRVWLILGALLPAACVPSPGAVTRTISAATSADASVSPDPGVRAMYYMTDRRPESATVQRSIYGRERSASMAFGRLSVTGNARKSTVLAREMVRFPRTPVPFSQKNGRIIPDAQGHLAYQTQSNLFQRDVGAALRRAGRSDVVVFVHGFNNDFDQSADTMRTLWQAAGRPGVPIVFSWPAGHAGLTGYLRDRESGEFSVFHLKELLRLLAGVRGLRAIHVVAHSRGADVATTALREMVIAARASGRNPRDVLKIDNLIMAAPDIDFGVVGQRLIAEGFGPAFGRISVYMNPGDGALALSQSLMSGTRFGRLTFADLDENEREIFTRIRNVDFIDVENVVARSGHGYFRENPAVLADIGTLLQQSLPPTDPRRYLTSEGVNFWVIANPPRSDGAVTGAAGGAR